MEITYVNDLNGGSEWGSNSKGVLRTRNLLKTIVAQNVKNAEYALSKYTNHNYDPKIGKAKTKKLRLCKACGKPGHRIDNCPDKTRNV